jgi:hypothetical protein
MSAIRITSKPDGEWYQVTGLAAALTAGTQYHLVLSNSDTGGTNFVAWCYTGVGKYPGGFENRGTNVPAWTQFTSFNQCFLIQNPAANQFLQSGGQFDAKFVFNNGNPVNQSKLLCQPMKSFFNGKQFTALIRGTGYAVSTPIADFAYGLDHERIAIQTNASGFVTVTYYPESDVTAPTTITGTVNVTTGGLKDIAVVGRFVGDGADYLKLYVNGVVDGIPVTAQTWAMSNDLRDLGTATLGGGFPLAPTWTVNTTAMAGLPSTLGWTYNSTGTANEAGEYSVSGGKLYQNANGFASVSTGNYSRTTSPTLVNATGWVVAWKSRIATASNTTANNYAEINVFDGTKSVIVIQHEYFLETAEFKIQGDFKSQEHVFSLQGKGSDYYLFIDGKLAIDGTGKLLSTTATNNVIVGDAAASGNHADAIYSYIKIYNGGMLLPTAATGASLSEFAHWSGDKSALLPLAYNAGTPISIKQLCGVERNYVGEGVVFSEVRRGVTSGATTTSTSLVVAPEMEAYILGSYVTGRYSDCVYNNTLTQSVATAIEVDGQVVVGSYTEFLQANAGYSTSTGSYGERPVLTGLHKVEGRWSVAANTGLERYTLRNLVVTSKA